MLCDFKWGVADCVTAAADAFQLVHRIDLLGTIRGAWRSVGQAARLLRRSGGLLSLATRMASAHRLRRVTDVPGAIGVRVTQIAGQGASLGAVLFCVEPGVWVGKTAEGLTSAYQPQRAWAPWPI